MICILIFGVIVSMIGEIGSGYILINEVNKLNLIWSIPLFIIGFLMIMAGVRETIM